MYKGRVKGQEVFQPRRFIYGSEQGTVADRTTPVRYAHQAQVVFSSGHPYQQLGKGNRKDIGGAFSSQKISVVTRGCAPRWHRGGTLTGNGWPYEYFTMLIPHSDVQLMNKMVTQGTTSMPNLVSLLFNQQTKALTTQELNTLGAKAVSAFQPLNPIADTATTIAEFASERKFFTVPGSSGSLPGEYLNYSFGVAPTVGFAQDLREAILHKDKLLSQLERDSGKWIRRRGTVLKEENDSGWVETKNVYPSYIGLLPVTALLRQGTLLKRTFVTRKVWFSGAFTYYLPKEGWRRSVAELDYLYGIKPNADVAWELIPFSWLADYKSNLGNVISNMTAFASDGLVMPYGYLMAHQTEHSQYKWTGEVRDDGGRWVSRTLSADIERSTKQRIVANPYGFGITPGSLSGRQMSILAALGLTLLEKK